MLTTDVLNLSTDIVCTIIAKAKEFQAKEAVTFDEKLANTEYEYDWAQVLADHKDDLTYKEIINIIENLEPDQRADLLALMYIGRGDFDENEWSQARKEARNNLAPHLGAYLLSKPQIADYLARGLEILGASCEE
jgi:hypothetical protein